MFLESTEILLQCLWLSLNLVTFAEDVNRLLAFLKEHLKTLSCTWGMFQKSIVFQAIMPPRKGGLGKMDRKMRGETLLSPLRNEQLL